MGNIASRWAKTSSRCGDVVVRKSQKERERERERKKESESKRHRKRERETERDTRTETETDTDRERKGRERMKKTKTERQSKKESTRVCTPSVFAAFLDLRVEFSVSLFLSLRALGAYIEQSLAIWCASSHLAPVGPMWCMLSTS